MLVGPYTPSSSWPVFLTNNLRDRGNLTTEGQKAKPFPSKLLAGTGESVTNYQAN
ncbi:hypothetical protein CLV24_106154 [Pontibacter ummariensis]|uniref:Uncharacterized protein n=1 Tax=Pontibacter ummariensis TaxID=1610492 RepID=A0A239EI10_9BACT|nr:hypothetical protein CLV24_106154 [Pontibacter ummariensis]SNS43542.1 hypothetical protein SAMN06296052_106154 [Pontibacter ummariensis]